MIKKSNGTLKKINLRNILINSLFAFLSAIYIFGCHYGSPYRLFLWGNIVLLDSLFFLILVHISDWITVLAFIPTTVVLCHFGLKRMNMDFDIYKYGSLFLLFLLKFSFDLYSVKTDHIAISMYFLMMVIMAFLFRRLFLFLYRKWEKHKFVIENVLVAVYFIICAEIAQLYLNNGIELSALFSYFVYFMVLQCVRKFLQNSEGFWIIELTYYIISLPLGYVFYRCF